MRALRGLKKAGISPQKGTEKAAPTWAAPHQESEQSLTWHRGVLPKLFQPAGSKNWSPQSQKGVVLFQVWLPSGSFCYRKSPRSSRDPTLQSIPAAAGLQKVHSLKKKKSLICKRNAASSIFSVRAVLYPPQARSTPLGYSEINTSPRRELAAPPMPKTLN